MSPEAPTTDRPLASEDLALLSGWELLEFLVSIGANEFAVDFIYCGDEAIEPCDRLIEKIAFASLGQQTRECTSTPAGQTNRRPVKVWRLDRESLAALRDIMPCGMFGADIASNARALASVEDLRVY